MSKIIGDPGLILFEAIKDELLLREQTNDTWELWSRAPLRAVSCPLILATIKSQPC